MLRASRDVHGDAVAAGFGKSHRGSGAVAVAFFFQDIEKLHESDELVPIFPVQYSRSSEIRKNRRGSGAATYFYKPSRRDSGSGTVTFFLISHRGAAAVDFLPR